ncbi:MAG TPA: hypothetical protein VK988_18500, partial [Acidimicrobiales bacterium]|nr:hypothetical protein [Acidimicrobiales bacterium]
MTCQQIGRSAVDVLVTPEDLHLGPPARPLLALRLGAAARYTRFELPSSLITERQQLTGVKAQQLTETGQVSVGGQ